MLARAALQLGASDYHLAEGHDALALTDNAKSAITDTISTM